MCIRDSPVISVSVSLPRPSLYTHTHTHTHVCHIYVCVVYICLLYTSGSSDSSVDSNSTCFWWIRFRLPRLLLVVHRLFMLSLRASTHKPLAYNLHISVILSGKSNWLLHYATLGSSLDQNQMNLTFIYILTHNPFYTLGVYRTA